MLSDDAIRTEAYAEGLRTKRNNLIVASLSGLALLLISTSVPPHHTSTESFLFGLVAGLVYANGFEYCLHRFLLHSGFGVFAHQHMVHHATLQSPEGARYVNFSRNPWGVVALFCGNALPFMALQWILHWSWISGIFPSFALYYMAFEEIHWRSHMGGWMPAWLRPAARHHLLHHAHDTDRFNVFLPVFDWLITFTSPARPRDAVERDVH
jgi:hypothetical protein